jgi:hypothetical protein
MMRAAVLALACAPLPFAQLNSAPKLPRIDENACPFEGMGWVRGNKEFDGSAGCA